MAIIAMSRQLGGLGMVDGAEAAKRLNYDCVQEEIISPISTLRPDSSA